MTLTRIKSRPDAEQYIALALATAPAVREADPKATIIGSATSELPVQFLEELFAAGMLAHLDAVGFHPYRSYRRRPSGGKECPFFAKGG